LLAKRVGPARATCVWRVTARQGLAGRLVLATPETDVTRTFVLRGR
jgi:hypothetical protein